MYKNDWPNYSTVYIWHEMLHSYFGRSDVEHAIIELITDEHMRKLLNSDTYPPFVGHEYLSDVKKKLLKDWLVFIKQNDKDINKFVKAHL